MKKALLVLAILLNGCATLTSLSAPTCEDYVKEQITERQKAGLIPLSKDGGPGWIVYSWIDGTKLEVHGLGFLFPEAAEYDLERLDIPNFKDEGRCKEGEKDVRIVSFFGPFPIVKESEAI